MIFFVILPVVSGGFALPSTKAELAETIFNMTIEKMKEKHTLDSDDAETLCKEFADIKQSRLKGKQY